MSSCGRPSLDQPLDWLPAGHKVVGLGEALETLSKFNPTFVKFRPTVHRRNAECFWRNEEFLTCRKCLWREEEDAFQNEMLAIRMMTLNELRWRFYGKSCLLELTLLFFWPWSNIKVSVLLLKFGHPCCLSFYHCQGSWICWLRNCYTTMLLLSIFHKRFEYHFSGNVFGIQILWPHWIT